MKQDFLFNMDHGSVNVDWMKAYVNQIKNGTIMNIGVSKQLDDLGSSKKGYMWNPSMCDCECNKACKIDKYLDTRNCSCKRNVCWHNFFDNYMVVIFLIA